MKKLYTLMVLILTIFSSTAQIVNIPDANFKTKLLSSATTNFVAKNLAGNYFKIDANSDSQIQVSEALQVSYLNISGASIASVQGINSFTSINYLDCSNNSFTTLTIDGFALLNNLIVAPNNSLFTLNVNNLPSLTTLNLFSQSFSTPLTNLVTLNCSNNALTALDFYVFSTALANLKYVNCTNNDIVTIDITSTQLFDLNVSNNLLTTIPQFNFEFNLLTSLNISGNNFTAFSLRGPEVTNFVYGNNPLTSLTITDFGNTALNINNVPTLQTLILDGSFPLTALSFSALPSLNLLRVNNSSLDLAVTVSELPSLQILRFTCSNSNLLLTGNLGFTVLKSGTTAPYIEVTSDVFHITNIPSVTNINITYFNVNTITIDNMPNVTNLSIPYSDNLQNIQLSNLPQVATMTIGYASDSINTNCINLVLENFPVLSNISLKNIRLSNLTLNSLPALTNFTDEGVSCSTTASSLVLTNLPLLYDAKILDPNLYSINVNNLNSLHDLKIYSKRLFSLTLTSLPQLYSFIYTLNSTSATISLPSLTLQNLPSLYSVYLNRPQISGLSLVNLPNLYSFICTNDFPSTSYVPNIIPYNISNLPLLYHLQLDEINTTSLTISNLPALNTIRMRASKIGETYAFQNLPFESIFINSMSTLKNITFNNLSNIKSISLVDSSNIQTLNLGNTNTTLQTFLLQTAIFIPSTSIQTLNFTNFPNLTSLTAKYSLASLVMSNLPQLSYLNCSSNKMNALTVSAFPSLSEMVCNYIQPPNSNTFLLTLTDLPALAKINVNYCNGYLKRLDLSDCPAISEVYYNLYNYTTTGTIEYVNLKNGNPNLAIFQSNQVTSMCVDNNAEKTLVQSLNANTANTIFTVYCSLTPGGDFYTIQGNNRFDLNANGCDNSDIAIPTLGFAISDGTITNNYFANTSGGYSIPLVAGQYTLTPFVENSSAFNFSPASITVDFPNQTNPLLQDFCITANGNHNDLEVSLLPILEARPGFDATYKIIYKNKGTQVQSGSIDLTYNDAILDLVTSSPLATNQSTNTLNWNFTNLLPFETREIAVKLNVNSTVESPAVQSGDVLTYTATISGATDETPNNNSSVLNQTVINAYDPNDKVCVEGLSISPSMVGQYVHYVIRFENTGNATAINIVVKDVIDSNKFDISSLIPQTGSHPFVTRISNTNQVEFIFANINLPFSNATNDGYVAFKIKTKPTLVLGDTFSNSADIYFDYNAPIITNTYITTIQALGNQDFEFNEVFSLSPVPTKERLTISTNQTLTISSVSIYNQLGQLVQISTNPSETIDVSGLQSGSYFIKIISYKGSATGKFIKE